MVIRPTTWLGRDDTRPPTLNTAGNTTHMPSPQHSVPTKAGGAAGTSTRIAIPTPASRAPARTVAARPIHRYKRSAVNRPTTIAPRKAPYPTAAPACEKSRKSLR